MNQTTEKTVSSSRSLVNCIGKTLIIAYKESTELLEKALEQEGLQWEVLRQETKEEYKEFSPSYRCLLNHKRAWEMAAAASKFTLIVEADFVPVVGLGQLPLPFDPEQKNVGIAWLYTCAPQIYTISAEGYATGFSASTVAYIVTPESAKNLIDLEDKIRKEIGANKYSSWDSEVNRFLRERQFKNYIPFRNYGEHGGLPNPEHRERGLSPSHRADVLYNKVAFMPIYASAQGKDNYLKFFLVRLQARLKGIGRLATGRYLRWKMVKLSKDPLRLMAFALSRHLTKVL